jgi:pyochelin biosynthetic protein PchC
VNTPWLRTFLPRPDATLRLVCFPHAGGSAAAYRTWAGELPENVETVAVQYPGRADRWAEPAHKTMSGLADNVAEALSDLAAKPYVFFGHSMGAAIAYETSLRLRDTGLPEPRLLVVSGRAPAQPPRHRPPRRRSRVARRARPFRRYSRRSPARPGAAGTRPRNHGR